MSLTTQDLSDVRELMIEAIAELVLPRFDEVDVQFDEVHAQFDEVNTRFGTVNERLSAIEVGVEHLKTRADDAKQRLLSLEIMARNQKHQADHTSGELLAVGADIKEIYQILKRLERQYQQQHIQGKHLTQRFEKLEAFCKQAALKLKIGLD